MQSLGRMERPPAGGGHLLLRGHRHWVRRRYCRAGIHAIHERLRRDCRVSKPRSALHSGLACLYLQRVGSQPRGRGTKLQLLDKRQPWLSLWGKRGQLQCLSYRPQFLPAVDGADARLHPDRARPQRQRLCPSRLRALAIYVEPVFWRLSEHLCRDALLLFVRATRRFLGPRSHHFIN